MKVQVLPARELTPELTAHWTRCQASDPALASPFFCAEFTQAVGAVMNHAEVGVIEQAQRVIGFFPYLRCAGRIGKPIGAPMCDAQGVIMEAGAEWDAAALVRACRLAAWDFDHLLAAQTPLAPYHRKSAASPIISCAGGYANYVEDLKARGSEQLSQAQRKARKLEREVGPLRFVCDERTPDSFQQRLRLKELQFGAFPAWATGILERILACRTPPFSGLLSVLYAGDTLVAAHLGMRSASVWHYWFPCYDTRFAAYSPGVLLLMHMAQAAPALNLATLDLGKGGQEYKRRLMNGSIPLAEGSVEVGAWLRARRGARRRCEAWVRGSPWLLQAARAVRNLRGAN
jgi:CelD/BcsL family acetyltransferase involved in cellulose biosynthesis